MLMKQVGHNGGDNNMRLDDSLTEDRFAGQTFDYFLTNPPFGVDWEQQQGEVKRGASKAGLRRPLRGRYRWDAEMIRVDVKPAVLRWACERARLDPAVLSMRMRSFPLGRAARSSRR